MGRILNVTDEEAALIYHSLLSGHLQIQSKNTKRYKVRFSVLVKIQNFFPLKYNSKELWSNRL